MACVSPAQGLSSAGGIFPPCWTAKPGGSSDIEIFRGRIESIAMRLTIVGTGDAWGSKGRSHTCFRVEAGGRCALIDFGASAIVAWNRMGLDLNAVDAIVISHLHGDHFGGLPFFLLQCQFETRRARPLTIYGPPGARARIEAAIEIFYPGVAARGWRFDWRIVEVEPGSNVDIGGFELLTLPVVHASGAPSTAVRLSRAGKSVAYSGDTEWTPMLEKICAGADLFIVECYAAQAHVPGHLNWSTLAENLGRLEAKRIAITHMGLTALDHVKDFSAAGLHILDDGQVIDI
jgi:ribonuclease BN (tRNA processing enzyme)